MTGLDKIIDRILADAKEEARAVLEGAQADCRKMAEEFAEKADAITASLAADAEERGERIVSRAKADAERRRETILADARRRAIDEAFDRAARQLQGEDFGKYTALLIALLSSALIEEAETAARSLALGDEVEPVECYEVLMNEKDRAAYGKVVVAEAKKAVLRRNGAERTEKVVLAQDSAPIDGGLILRYGNTELNCSLSLLMAEMRTALESRVAAVLFPPEEN